MAIRYFKVILDNRYCDNYYQESEHMLQINFIGLILHQFFSAFVKILDQVRTRFWDLHYR